MKPAKDFIIFVVKLLLLAGIVVVLSGCNQRAFRAETGFVPESGDLLFQDLDSGPLCDAIEKVTIGYEGANFSHVGIAAADENGNIVVIEAVSSGVEVTPLRTFLKRSLDTKGRPKVVVGRLKKSYRHLIAPAIEEALALKGRPYDKVFAIDNGAFYCSELVYEVFRRANNDTAVFELQPMTFLEPGSRQTQQTWREYFTTLGVSVPEGRPGINPGGISRSAALVIVHKYGNPSRSLRADVRSSTGVPPVSPTGVPAFAGMTLPVEDDKMQGQDGPATYGQDAHATTRPLLIHALRAAGQEPLISKTTF